MERAAFMGPRIRRLRRELGLTQPGMAADLGVSASYVSLLESNGRPVTADMLLRLARTYRIDLADFAGDGGAEATARLRAALKDPLFADVDLPALQIADVAASYPGMAEAFLRLHAAHQAQALALADRPGGDAGPDAVAAVRRFLGDRGNALPELDAAGEAIAAALGEAGGEAAHLSARHALRVRIVPGEVLAGLVRRCDPHASAVFLDERLSAEARAFQLALQIAYLELGSALDALVRDAGVMEGDARRLLRRALATYAAGAIRMPLAAFAAAAAGTRYDVELLARRFGADVEQAAYRLTALPRMEGEHPPLSFVRLDAAGNVSKRADGAGFPLAEQGGGCPVWSAHRALATPGRLLTQWVELPDGRRFLSVAIAPASSGGGLGAPRPERVMALICAAEHAGRLVYAGADAEPTPIGITCRLCQRDACTARAAPPIGRGLLPDDRHRRAAPYAFADG